MGSGMHVVNWPSLIDEAYPGGWGVGYFPDEGPMVIKEPIKATDSFALPGAVRRAEPGFIMAHVRNPTSGDKSVLNTHPFQKDGWLFSHNGTLGDPGSMMAKLLERYSDSLQGGTDSEIMFHYLLQRIEQAGQAEAGVLAAIRDMCRDQARNTSLNFVLTDGTVLFTFSKAFINHEKYSMNFARLDSLGPVVGEHAFRDHGASNGIVVSSDPFTPGGWSGLEMGDVLIAKVGARRIVRM